MHFKKCPPLLIAGLLLAAISSKAQQPFGAGNLVVYRAGDGSTALSNAAAPVFIDEYTPGGTLVQSIAMPTTVSGSNYRLVESGSASSDGIMHLSPNGKYLTLTGYDAATGTASVASSSGTTVSRVVAIMNSQGAYNTSSAYNIISGANIRSAVTTDSSNLWISGGGSGGIYYATAGTATQISGTANNTRAVNIFNGQLYYSSGSGSYRVGTVGTGIPTTTGQILTNLPGLPATGSPYDFFIATLTGGNQVLYIADDGSAAGIMKYSLVSGSWVANGTVGTGSDGYRGITGTVNGNAVTLYATAATTATPPVSKLVVISDTMGYNVAISSSNTSLATIATPGTNKVFRGVAFAPQCPAPAIGTQPLAQTVCAGSNVTFTTAATGTGLTYQWMKNGTAIPGASNTTYSITGAAMSDTGNYSVVITACSSTTSNTAHLTVNAIPTATITPAGSTTICSGSSVVLNANTGTGLTYQWYNGATLLSGATNAGYSANAAGSYTVAVTSNSCVATSAATAVTVNALPSAVITPAGATTFCQGGSVVLNANTGTGLTYQWYNGAAQITGATNAGYTTNTTGSYTVAVTSNSCVATSAATAVTVNALPAAVITPAGSTTICTGGSVVLNANTGTGLTYQWYNGATQISGQTGSSYTATVAGNYTVTVSNSTCSATSAATTVTVFGSTGATITPAGTVAICQGDSTLLSANTGTGLTYQWIQGTANITGATAATYKAFAAGSYTVTVSNGTCSSTSAATVVTVNSLPTAAVTPAGTTTFCQGGSVSLAANSGSGLSYQWQQGTGNISGATSASYIANTSGVYTVKVTDGNNCSSISAATTVTVNPKPTATITAATDTTFCQGGSVVLNATTGTGLTYQWKQGTANISGATTAAYTATTAGSYSVIVTNANSCKDSSVSKTVTVNALPAATVTAATGTTFCQGGSVVLNANTGTGLAYQWKQGTANISGATAAAYTATTTGSYSVIVTNTNSCKDSSAAKTVTVHPLPVATVTVNGFNLSTGSFNTYQWYYNNQPVNGATGQNITATQNGGYYVMVADSNGCTNNSDTVTITKVGITNVKTAAELRIYPNPVTDVLHIETTVPVQVVIRDMTGKPVIMATETNQVLLGNQPDGLYMISVTDKTGHVLYNGRFLKITR